MQGGAASGLPLGEGAGGGRGRAASGRWPTDTDRVQLLLLLQDKEWVHLSHPQVNERQVKERLEQELSFSLFFYII
jgi:hypothetical protein